VTDAVLAAGGFERDTPEYDWLSLWAQLVYVTVPIELLDTEITLFNGVFYLAMGVFFDEPRSECAEPCPPLKFSEKWR